MCFNMVAISKKRNMLTLLPEIVAEMMLNRDGFFLYSYPSRAYIRTLDTKEFVRSLLRELVRSTAIHIHLRLASCGAVVEENVHGWKIGKYYVTHNGHVYEYMGLTRRIYFNYININEYDTYSDTYRFVHEEAFANALEDNNWRELYRLAKEKGLYGVMLITDEDFDEVYALTRFKSVKVYKTKDTVIAANDPIDIDTEKEEYINSVIRITIDRVEELYKEDEDTFIPPKKTRKWWIPKHIEEYNIEEYHI